jgi:hypothetical protein
MTRKGIEEAILSELASDPIRPKSKQKSNGKPGRASILSADELLKLEAPERVMLIDTILPTPGAVLLVGAHKSGKTVLAAQMAIAIATGHPLMDNYAIIGGQRPVLIVEQDDPAGDISFRDYIKVSLVSLAGMPLYLCTRIEQRLGFDFNSWLESEITGRRVACVVLDSYTALRPHRAPGGDIVKTESEELMAIDALAKRTKCTIIVITHVSKGSNAMDWSDQTAGSYSLGAAVEAQIHISRFKFLPGDAHERLMQGRGRHIQDFEAVLRFHVASLDYQHVLDGPAASTFVELQELHRTFADREFMQKDVCAETGLARSTAFRLLARLYAAGAVEKPSYGLYRIVQSVARQL